MGRAALAVLLAVLATGLLVAPAVASAIPRKPKVAATPANVAPPVVTGIAAVGQTLSCSTGIWTNGPSAFSFAWLRNGAVIAGQAGSTYVVQSVDPGHAISCRVTASNGSGSYAVGSLPSGSYHVRFSAPEEGANYLSQFFNGKNLFSEAGAVSVVAPAAAGGIDAEMHAGGQIVGRAVDANTSAPLEGIFVCAEQATSEEETEGCAITGSNGEYAISGLPSGEYKVEFSTFFSTVSYYTQFFNERNTFGTADVVNVTAGATSTGINARMRSTDEGGQISGSVTKAAGGAAIEGVRVCAYSEALFLEQCAETNASGEYAIGGLAQASYVVSFSPEACEESGCSPLNYIAQYYNEKNALETPDPVAVTAGKTTANVNAKLAEGGEIAGHVTGPSGEGLANVFACAEAAGVIRCGASDGSGAYTLVGLPSTGTYIVSFETFTGGFVPLFYDEKLSASEATPVAVKTGEVTSGIDAKLVRGGRIAGTATDATSHQPLAEVQACAYEKGSPDGCAQTGPSGEYEITGLQAGTYEIRFSAGGESLNYLPTSISGVSVALGGDATGENAGLDPGGQIAGRVTDAATHKGLVGAQVCVEQVGGELFRCVLTDAESSSQAATSAAVTIAGGFKLVKKPVFDAKTDDIDFFFSFSTPGKLSWSLFFKNADVGFADSLGVSLGQGTAVAEVAKKGKSRKSKKCKKGEIKRHGKCKRVLVPFASGAKSVPAGIVEVKVHADAKATKALKSGHALHISGSFDFQPSAGGPPTRIGVSATAKVPPKKHHKRKHKGKKR